MTENIMEFRHVGKQYDDNVVLRDINFKIEAGKFYTLLGPSGSGKTTILRLIAGFDQPTSGEIYFAGQEINDVPANRRQVNTVFQDYALFPHMNVAENVAFGLQIKGVKKSEIKRRVDEALQLVQLAGYGAREITAMSGVSGSGWRLPGQLSTSPRYCYWMRPCQRWTISCGCRCRPSSVSCSVNWGSRLSSLPTTRKRPSR